MRNLVIAGICSVAAVQLLAITQLDRDLVVGVTGAAVAGVLLVARWYLIHRAADTVTDAAADDAGAPLRRWLTRTEALIAWSEGSRSDWDRRLRPMLARQFELAAGQRKAKDPKAFHATGRMLFGEGLWQWVDPENVSRTAAQEPGPGRDTLNDILQRLERL
ncbi:hypothetical protein NGTWS0302_34620 [Mycolicibacterium cyprinidarum]|uniref:Uncharacterized protein n=1 Tax=Mycolicibacterium cyprinidarum TaxID=2860311 RepID=A0ABQ4VDP0_9MYCO|nr:hypothetical protein NGTWS0302_34620 [Mycolicibacterium sp. NGTWS0302]GJF18369.1 hypothetical protein NGTWS1702_26240 [Mycolicibacterium sp. NGTWSNA01]